MGDRVLIVGGGVSGMTTADVLSSQGYEVIVLADRDVSQTPSVVAGALWEWQPAVCGHHRDEKSLERSKAWCLTSYRRFRELAKDHRSGVSIRRSHFYFYRRLEESGHEHRKMLELMPHVDGFVRDPQLIRANGINPDLGLADAYAHWAPVIATDVYLAYLRRRLLRRGCRFLRRRMEGDLRETAPSLLAEFDVSLVVNCAGLGARELASDPMFPLRGALVRMINDGHGMAAVRAAHCIANDESRTEQNMIYLVPRGSDRLLLGGIAEPREWHTGIDLANCDAVRNILKRCREFMPRLRQGKLDAAPVTVGLRPSRSHNVRLESEPADPIIHNYGHGGSGFSLSWGCAGEVADLARTKAVQRRQLAKRPHR